MSGLSPSLSLYVQLVFQLANDEGRFSVDDEGQITLLDSLNREARGSYNLTVTVSDRGQQPRSTTGYLYIEVTDVNDEEPQLDRVRVQARDTYDYLVVSASEAVQDKHFINNICSRCYSEIHMLNLVVFQ